MRFSSLIAVGVISIASVTYSFATETDSEKNLQCELIDKTEKPDGAVPDVGLRNAIAQEIVEHAWKRKEGDDFNNDLGISTKKSLLVLVKKVMDVKNDDNSDERMTALHTRLNVDKDKRAWWLKVKGKSNGLFVVFDHYGKSCGTTFPKKKKYYDEDAFNLS